MLRCTLMGGMAIVLLSLFGCSIQRTTTTTWTHPADVLIWEKKDLPDVQCGTGTLTDTTCWCNAHGDWGFDGVLLNKEDKPHRFTVTVTFGHQNGSDERTYVPFKTVLTLVVDCAAHERHEVHGRDEGDSVVRTNFRSLNDMAHTLATD